MGSRFANQPGTTGLKWKEQAPSRFLRNELSAPLDLRRFYETNQAGQKTSSHSDTANGQRSTLRNEVVEDVLKDISPLSNEVTPDKTQAARSPSTFSMPDDSAGPTCGSAHSIVNVGQITVNVLRWRKSGKRGYCPSSSLIPVWGETEQSRGYAHFANPLIRPTPRSFALRAHSGPSPKLRRSCEVEVEVAQATVDPAIPTPFARGEYQSG